MEIGTEILLKRIQDCPEEFADHDIHGMGRWSRVLNAAQDCLPLDESEAIKKAIGESRRQHMLDKFNEQVLKTLAGENTDTDPDRQSYLTSLNNTFTGGVIANSQKYSSGWTDPRGVLSQGGVLSQSGNAAAQAQQNNSGLLSKLGNIF
jgi:hypothetical protein